MLTSVNLIVELYVSPFNSATIDSYIFLIFISSFIIIFIISDNTP